MQTLMRQAWLVFIFCLLAGFAHAGEDDLLNFLYSKPNTYGWQPVKGEVSYDFIQGGRLNVQGKEGPAAMWIGTWKLKGDQLTLDVPAKKFHQKFTVAKDGHDLLLDGQRYRRYVITK